MESFVNCVEKEVILQQINEFDDRYYISRDYEITFPQVNIVIKQDRQLVTVGGTQLTFYLAPGHTSDGIFTIVEPLGICEQSLQYIASLRESIVSSDEAALDAFINDSPFPIGMRKFHEDNKALVKKELQSKNS